MDIRTQVFVQLRIAGRFPTDEEKRVRDELAQTIDTALRQKRLGGFKNAGIGNGVTNIVFFDVPPPRSKDAIDVVLLELRDRGLLDRARVIREETDWDELDYEEFGGEDATDYLIVWPQDDQGEFSGLYEW